MCNASEIFNFDYSGNRLESTIRFDCYVNNVHCDEFSAAVIPGEDAGPEVGIPIITDLNDENQWLNSRTIATIEDNSREPNYLVRYEDETYISVDANGETHQPLFITVGSIPSIPGGTTKIHSTDQDGIWIAGAIDDGSGDIGGTA